MTVHCVKLKAAKDVSLEEAQKTVDDWRSNHEEVLTIQSSSLSVKNTEPINDTGTDYFSGIYRFSSNQDKKTLLDEIANSLEQAVLWYQIDYHECDHDSENSSGCPSWSPDREHGTIPEGI